MAGITRTLTFAEGVATLGPTTTFLQTTQFATYADEATFVSNKGSAAADGDAFYDTTLDVVKIYANGAWQIIFDDSDTNVALLTGTQTFSGAKTFSSAVNISDTTNATSKDTGALIVEGGIGVEKDVYIGGDLTVDGTSTTINTETLDVEDANVTVNKGGNQSTADSNDAGFTVEMSDATDCLVHYDSTATSKWKAGESGSTKEVVTISDTQVITNKDIDGGTASDSLRMTLPKNDTSSLNGLTRKEGTLVFDTDVSKVKYDDGTNLNELGGGAGGINYITNSDAEGGVTDWSTFDDSSAYVDGTGGSSANLTLTQNSSSPLRGNADFDLVVSASNARYEGVSTDFTIDKADKFSMLSISFDYFTDAPDDFFSVRIYDVTNAEIIYPVPQDIKASSVENKFVSQFQTTDSTSYRLSIFVNDTDATGYTINFDNVTVGPSKKLIGTPVTDWIAYTPTWDGETVQPSLGNGVLNGFYRRVGDSAECQIYLKAGSTTTFGTGTWRFTLPSGLTCDRDKMPGDESISYDNSSFGSFTTYDVSATFGTNNSGNCVYQFSSYAGGTTEGVFLLNTVSGATVKTSVPFTWTTDDKLSINFTIPVTGWGSNVKMSDIDSGRVVAARASASSTSLTNGADVQVVFGTVDYDTHGSYDNGTGLYSIPESGKYNLASHLYTASASFSVGNTIRMGLKVNGSVVCYLHDYVVHSAVTTSMSMVGSTSYDFTKGDTVAITGFQNSGGAVALSNSSARQHFSIQKIQGPNSILASEIVACVYETNSGQSIGTSETDMIYDDRISDTHNAYNVSTGEFTVPVSKFYTITGCYETSSTVWGAGGGPSIYINIDGSKESQNYFRVVAASTTYIHASIVRTVYLTQGQIMKITADSTTATTITSGASSVIRNQLSIIGH